MLDRILSFIAGILYQPIKVQYASGTITRTLCYKTTLTAPTITGYTFVCWIHVSTHGWFGSVYPEIGNSQTTNFWLAATPGPNGQNGEIRAWALYVRNQLA